MTEEKMVQKLAFGLILGMRRSITAFGLVDAGQLPREEAYRVAYNDLDAALAFATGVVTDDKDWWGQSAIELDQLADEVLKRALTGSSVTRALGDALQATCAAAMGALEDAKNTN